MDKKNLDASLKKVKCGQTTSSKRWYLSNAALVGMLRA